MEKLERAALALETRKWRSEVRLRVQELALKEREISQQRSHQFTSLSVALIAAAAAITGASISAVTQTNAEQARNTAAVDLEKVRIKATAEVELARHAAASHAQAAEFESRESLATREFEYNLIRDAMTIADPLKSRERLKFLVEYDFVKSVKLRHGIELRINQDPGASKPDVPTSNLIARYERILFGSPRDVDTLVLLGFALYKVGRLEDAERRLNEALTLSPNSPWGLYNAAIVSCSMKRFDVADSQLTKLFSQHQEFKDTVKRHGQFDACKANSEVLKKLL